MMLMRAKMEIKAISRWSLKRKAEKSLARKGPKRTKRSKSRVTRRHKMAQTRRQGRISKTSKKSKRKRMASLSKRTWLLIRGDSQLVKISKVPKKLGQKLSPRTETSLKTKTTVLLRKRCTKLRKNRVAK